MAKRTSKRIIRFNEQNNNFVGASHFFVYFSAGFAQLTMWKCLVLCSMENVNKQQQNFISLAELEYGPLEFKFRRVCIHLTKYESRNNGDKDWENANSLFEQHSRYRCVVGSLIPSLTFNSPLSLWNIFKSTPPLSVSLGAVWV